MTLILLVQAEIESSAWTWFTGKGHKSGKCALEEQSSGQTMVLDGATV